MPAKVLLRGVTANCDRGARTALFPALPMLVVALMTLPATSAFAGSSILEIEPPLEATSKHAAAEGANAKASYDDADADDDDDDDDEDQVASKNSLVPGKPASAYSSASSNYETSTSAQRDDADDDSDDDDDDAGDEIAR